MTTATVAKTVRGIATQDGAGVKLSRIIGQRDLQNLDPFLMLDEFGSASAQDYLPGFPSHPHRGFQTVTYMLQGKMRHRDSVGNDGVIESGGIQWMNAGRGIIHEEMPEQQEGVLRGFQLWVNLPAKDKMSAPNYQDIPASEVTVFDVTDNTEVRLLSGEFLEHSGPVKPLAGDNPTPLFTDFCSYQPDSLELVLQSDMQYFIYVYEGRLVVGSEVVDKGELAVLSRDDALRLETQVANTRWLLIGGKPLNEPIVQYGPFVMNTEAEIHQALQDYQQNRLTTV
ncbi:pirin family protein [Alteromonas sp. ASW11-36]|uniref:Pirin family protein n=1 Tax=Alteromonas arenosi TaxID=3055817 RepID=A0ABT7SWV8_9ALTE|nr:pirin family protein [Alteromonas sp. ASW11-36]MDM7860676.1 pirin family protein [Alteromonas sp. ASW11-36]